MYNDVDNDGEICEILYICFNVIVFSVFYF